jgi:hypothetical protein
VAAPSITKTFRIKDDKAMQRYIRIMEGPAEPLPKDKDFSLEKEMEKLKRDLSR